MLNWMPQVTREVAYLLAQGVTLPNSGMQLNRDTVTPPGG